MNCFDLFMTLTCIGCTVHPDLQWYPTTVRTKSELLQLVLGTLKLCQRKSMMQPAEEVEEVQILSVEIPEALPKRFVSKLAKPPGNSPKRPKSPAKNNLSGWELTQAGRPYFLNNQKQPLTIDTSTTDFTQQKRPSTAGAISNKSKKIIYNAFIFVYIYFILFLCKEFTRVGERIELEYSHEPLQQHPERRKSTPPSPYKLTQSPVCITKEYERNIEALELRRVTSAQARRKIRSLDEQNDMNYHALTTIVRKELTQAVVKSFDSNGCVNIITTLTMSLFKSCPFTS